MPKKGGYLLGRIYQSLLSTHIVWRDLRPWVLAKPHCRTSGRCLRIADTRPVSYSNGPHLSLSLLYPLATTDDECSWPSDEQPDLEYEMELGRCFEEAEEARKAERAKMQEEMEAIDAKEMTVIENVEGTEEKEQAVGNHYFGAKSSVEKTTEERTLKLQGVGEIGEPERLKGSVETEVDQDPCPDLFLDDGEDDTLDSILARDT